MQPLFGNTDAAHRLMAVPKPDETFGVNVVIIDQGVSRSLVDNFRGVFGGGWEVPEGPTPGATRGGHGSMLARNILQVAPGATIFDLPIVPADITNVPAFLSDAHAAFSQMLANIEGLRETGDARWQRPWVLVNAWAAFNLGNEHRRGGESGAANHPLNYSANPEHPLNIIIGQAASKHDVVFAAGNCGQFCPSQRCGVDDVGPGRSIIGANSHPDVLTVGAVRTDGLWLGYSSQGPGALCHDKPDVCAPSQFSDNEDAYAGNTGTSAACALAAGVVARLRGKWDGEAFSPAEMKRILTGTAFGRVEHSRWDGQLGHGIINYARATAAKGRAVTLAL
jgi:subtilisin family serine protease